MNANALDALIQKSMTRELGLKGYRNEAPPDFLIQYLLVTEAELHLGRTTGLKELDSPEKEYVEGTLVIEVLAPEDGTRMWRAVAEGAVPEISRQKRGAELIDEAISEMLKSFPVSHAAPGVE